MKKTAVPSEAEPFENRMEILSLATDIVSAYVSNNVVAEGDLPSVIGRVFGALQDLGGGKPAASARPEPAVPVKKSVFPDYIVCLEDGKKFNMLKRHLKTVYGLTPDAYRERWGLSSDYPMVSPNYAKKRSRLARENGLGKKRAGK